MKRFAYLGGLGLAVAGLVVAMPGAASAQSPSKVSCSGDAYGASINGNVIVDSGQLPGSCVPSRDNSLLDTAQIGVPYPPLHAEALSEDVFFMNEQDSDPNLPGGGYNPPTAAAGDAGVYPSVFSESDATEIQISDGNGHTVSADVLNATAEAECNTTTGGPEVEGSSEIAGLSYNGSPVASVSTAPNTTIPLGPLTVTLNEQSSKVTPTYGEMSVNAIHVTEATTGTDVIVSHADADIGNCPPAAPPPPPSTCPATHNFVTGGGFIEGPTTGGNPAAGSKGNFGFVAGRNEKGALFGRLEYLDHSPPGMPAPKVHGTGVTYYNCTSPASREFDGPAVVNGVSGFCYKTDVSDPEGGAPDTFEIRLYTGPPGADGQCQGNPIYQAGPAPLNGGHIEIHVGD